MHVSEHVYKTPLGEHRLPAVLEGANDHDEFGAKTDSLYLHHIVVIPHTEDGLMLPTDQGQPLLVTNAICASTKLAPADTDVMRVARQLAMNMACQPAVSDTQLVPHGMLMIWDVNKREQHYAYVVFAKTEFTEVDGFTLFKDFDELMGGPLHPMTKDFLTQLHEHEFIGDAYGRAKAAPARKPSIPPESKKPEITVTAKTQEKKTMQATTTAVNPFLASDKPLSIIMPMFNGQVMLGSTGDKKGAAWSLLHKHLCLETVPRGDDSVNVMRHAKLIPDFVSLECSQVVTVDGRQVTVYIASLKSIRAQFGTSSFSSGLRSIPRAEVEEILAGSTFHDSFTTAVFNALADIVLPPIKAKVAASS